MWSEYLVGYEKQERKYVIFENKVGDRVVVPAQHNEERDYDFVSKKK